MDRAGVAQRLSHVLHNCCFGEDSQRRGFQITHQKAVILGKEDGAQESLRSALLPNKL